MSFEKLAISRLVTDPAYLKKVLPHLQSEYFHDLAERKVFEIIKDYANKYKVAPSKDAIAIILNEQAVSEAVYEGCGSIINEIQPDTETGLDWMVDQTESLVKEKAMYNAVMSAIEILDGKNKKLDKHAIPAIMTKALGVDFNSKLGHDYFENAESQFDYMHAEDTRFPFAIEILNRATRGGVKKRTLNIVMAGIGVGKTTWLINQAAHWLMEGKNVLYISLEVDEPVIRERLDVNLYDINFDKLYALQKVQYLNKVNSLREKTKGEFKCIQFAPGSHVGHFRHTIEELRIKKGFIPDMIVIDYLTICGSSLLPPSAKGNSDTYFTSVAEELRALAFECNCPVWTAAQFDRLGQDSEDIKMANTGQSIGIQKTSDFTLAITTSELLIGQLLCVGKILKNRYSERGATIKKFMMGLDNALQKFFNVDASLQDDEGTREALKQPASQPAPDKPKTLWNF